MMRVRDLEDDHHDIKTDQCTYVGSRACCTNEVYINMHGNLVGPYTPVPNRCLVLDSTYLRVQAWNQCGYHQNIKIGALQHHRTNILKKRLGSEQAQLPA